MKQLKIEKTGQSIEIKIECCNQSMKIVEIKSWDVPMEAMIMFQCLKCKKCHNLSLV